jgi:hypothetical protein
LSRGKGERRGEEKRGGEGGGEESIGRRRKRMRRISDCQLYESRSHSLIAFDKSIMQDLSSMSQNRQRVFATHLQHAPLLQAWESNKRHMKAISDERACINYGVRKEVTFRLNVILANKAP